MCVTIFGNLKDIPHLNWHTEPVVGGEYTVEETISQECVGECVKAVHHPMVVRNFEGKVVASRSMVIEMEGA